MKIAILSQSYPPMVSGAALFAKRLADHISARGHQVLVLAASDRQYPYRLSKPNLLVERCRSYHNPFRVGQRFALWPHGRIMQCLQEFSPDLIHLHDPFQFALSSLLFSCPRRVPVLFTIHQLPWFVSASFPIGNGLGETVENGLWRYARWLLNHCAGAAVGTQTIAEVVCAHTGIYPRIISHGVDLSAFSPDPSDLFPEAALRARLGIPENAPIILHVGRLDKDKQVKKAIQAAAIAMQQTPAHLLIVGDGTERTHLNQLCIHLGIGERSHFPGFVSVEEGLPAFYRAARVFVMASEIETQGLVLLEAAACALPIVAVQATCLHEIVHEGKNGFLLPPGDVAGMADRLIELIQNPAQAHKMGQIGKLIVESHAAERTFDAYEDFYRAAIQEAHLISSLLRAGAPGRARHSGESD